MLDQYQDEIFRLPLDKRLLILGPPGTGKTTTLIRRLGQKLDTAFLEEGERSAWLVASAQPRALRTRQLVDVHTHGAVEAILKEAFFREGVLASGSAYS